MYTAMENQSYAQPNEEKSKKGKRRSKMKGRHEHKKKCSPINVTTILLILINVKCWTFDTNIILFLAKEFKRKLAFIKNSFRWALENSTRVYWMWMSGGEYTVMHSSVLDFLSQRIKRNHTKSNGNEWEKERKIAYAQFCGMFPWWHFCAR